MKMKAEVKQKETDEGQVPHQNVQMKPMLKNENLRDDFRTGHLPSATIKAENDSMMPAQMRLHPRAALRIPWQTHITASSSVPMNRENSAISTAQQHYQEHPKIPLLPDHRECVNLQGNSSMAGRSKQLLKDECWKKHTKVQALLGNHLQKPHSRHSISYFSIQQVICTKTCF